MSSAASVNTAHGLVVGTDGSASSLALEFAATEARVRSLPLEVVNTWECLTTYGGTYPDIDIAGDAKRVLHRRGFVQRLERWSERREVKA